MLERDYITRIIETFSKNAAHALRVVLIAGNHRGIVETEKAVGEALEMDPTTLFALDPESFVTMMRLGGNGEALGDYISYALENLADAYRDAGDTQTAKLRREQARAVAGAFGVSRNTIPKEFKDLDAEIQTKKQHR